jgi:hypothetical protein
MVKLPQMSNVRLFLVFDFLDGDHIVADAALEHGALGSGSEPFEIADGIERSFPIVTCSVRNRNE